MTQPTMTQPTQSYHPRGEFMRGVRDTVPMIVGAVPFGIIFGALGVTSGLSEFAIMGLSLFVFAGSAQFIAVGLLTQGVGIVFIILTTFIVNLRHMLYSASLAPYMRHLSQKWLIPLGFWLTDETYAVVIGRYAQGDEGGKAWYHLGSAVAMYTNWQLSTLIGIVAGTQLQGLASWGLDFAMVVTFIGIVVPLIITRPMLMSALVAGVVAVLTYDMPNRLGLIVSALIGIGAGIVAEHYLTKGETHHAP